MSFYGAYYPSSPISASPLSTPDMSPSTTKEFSSSDEIVPELLENMKSLSRNLQGSDITSISLAIISAKNLYASVENYLKSLGHPIHVEAKRGSAISAAPLSENPFGSPAQSPRVSTLLTRKQSLDQQKAREVPNHLSSSPSAAAAAAPSSIRTESNQVITATNIHTLLFVLKDKMTKLKDDVVKSRKEWPANIHPNFNNHQAGEEKIADIRHFIDQNNAITREFYSLILFVQETKSKFKEHTYTPLSLEDEAKFAVVFKMQIEQVKACYKSAELDQLQFKKILEEIPEIEELSKELVLEIDQAITVFTVNGKPIHKARWRVDHKDIIEPNLWRTPLIPIEHRVLIANGLQPRQHVKFNL